MDEYLQCLYNYILEVRRDETLRKTPEYRMERISLLTMMRTMDADLSEEQQKIVNRYLSCQSRLSALEGEWLFQEAVSLGRWLAAGGPPKAAGPYKSPVGAGPLAGPSAGNAGACPRPAPRTGPRCCCR